MTSDNNQEAVKAWIDKKTGRYYIDLRGAPAGAELIQINITPIESKEPVSPVAEEKTLRCFVCGSFTGIHGNHCPYYEKPVIKESLTTEENNFAQALEGETQNDTLRRLNRDATREWSKSLFKINELEDKIGELMNDMLDREYKIKADADERAKISKIANDNGWNELTDSRSLEDFFRIEFKEMSDCIKADAVEIERLKKNSEDWRTLANSWRFEHGLTSEQNEKLESQLKKIREVLK